MALGIEYSRLIAATLRHIASWQQGEDYDEESGHPHLAHATFGLLAILSFEEDPSRAAELDDRVDLRGRRLFELPDDDPDDDPDDGERPSNHHFWTEEEIKEVIQYISRWASR